LAEEFYGNNSESKDIVSAGNFRSEPEQCSEENKDTETEDLMLHCWTRHPQSVEGL
jgi:hypothetical protein